MPSTSIEEISKLSLDLNNFRTIPQKEEKDAIKAMVTIKPDRFYAMMRSLLADGYLPTENIIVLKDGDKLTVKEGNRRIAALKLIHGYYSAGDFSLPSDIATEISSIDSNWKSQNLTVPCAIYEPHELEIADKVVSLTHGKGEQASRDDWSSVARARHNRDAKGISEPALDLLEKYLKMGRNITDEQKERWSGDYPLTVLLEAMRFIAPRLGFANTTELANAYPKSVDTSHIDTLLKDIGLEFLKFKHIRDTSVDFAVEYGVPPIVVPTPEPTPIAAETVTPQNSSTNTSPRIPIDSQPIPSDQPNIPQPPAMPTEPVVTNASQPVAALAKKAVAVNDPKNVATLLRSFVPRGIGREKVVALRDEIKKLKINETPIAFCFLLRSMFEISAKAYCADHSIITTRRGSTQEKTLAELLKEIKNHLTDNNSDTAKVRAIHGAYTEVNKPEGILSVTSMNQLVHHPSFSVIPSDICILFSNVFPLLKAMN